MRVLPELPDIATSFPPKAHLADGTILRDEHGRDRSSLYPTLEANNGRRMFQAISLLGELGMDEGFMQEYESASHYYRPDFNDAEKPSRTLEIFNN